MCHYVVQISHGVSSETACGSYIAIADSLGLVAQFCMNIPEIRDISSVWSYDRGSVNCGLIYNFMWHSTCPNTEIDLGGLLVCPGTSVRAPGWVRDRHITN